MRIATRVKKLEGAVPKCDPQVLRLAPEGHVPSAADRCRLCGGCHVVVIEEDVLESGPEGSARSSSPR